MIQLTIIAPIICISGSTPDVLVLFAGFSTLPHLIHSLKHTLYNIDFASNCFAEICIYHSLHPTACLILIDTDLDGIVQ